MTPSTTFQWPPSPSGIFQPVRSLPLNRDVNPAGMALWASSRASVIAVGSTTSRARASAAADIHAVAFIGLLLLNSRALGKQITLLGAVNPSSSKGVRAQWRAVLRA